MIEHTLLDLDIYGAEQGASTGFYAWAYSKEIAGWAPEDEEFGDFGCGEASCVGTDTGTGNEHNLNFAGVSLNTGCSWSALGQVHSSIY